MKRFLAIFLSLVMLFMLIPHTVFAEGELKYGVLTYEIVNDEIVITDCDVNASGKIVIPEKIGGLPVTADRRWY